MDKETGSLGDLIQPAEEILLTNYLKENNLLNLLPVAVYVCDMSGIIKRYNEQAVNLWGRRPVTGEKDARFSGAYKLYYPDGSYLPHNDTPVAACLKDGLPRKDVEIIIETPDLSHIWVRENIVPIKDDDGNQIGIINCFYDISHQKETERKLSTKTIELQDYVDNANIGLHWVDANGIIKWANKAELNLLGYTPEEYIGQHISKFHVHQGKIEDILNRLSCNEVLDQYESELRCKDGTIKTVHISSSVYREEGNFIHTRCFTIDVTPQKQLFEALTEGEKRYRELIQTLQTPLYTTDEQGRITLFNKAAADLWGREPEIGKDVWCGSYRILKTDGSELPLDSCPMAVCLKEQRPVYGEEILVIRPDGALRHVAPHPQPIFNSSGTMIGAINMLIDITAIKSVEKALRDSEAKYRNLANSLEEMVKEKTQDLINKTEQLKRSEERYHKMVDEVEDYAIILLDNRGIIQNWNKGAEKIKGYKQEEIVGRSFEIFYRLEDREKGLPLKLLADAVNNGKAIHEGWRQRKNGSTFWGSSVLTALHDDKNSIIGFTKVTRDLTEKKLAEDKNKEYLAQLEFQNQELEQFAYVASHDLKEPLRKIHLYNNFIAGNPLNQLDDKSTEYLSRSIYAVDRMKKLIEDLLSYSRITSGGQGYEEIDLNKLVEELRTFHKEEDEQGRVDFKAGTLATIRGISFQIKQLLFNLIDNCIKYKHPDRNLIIKIGTEIVRGNDITGYKAKPGTEYYKISVEDNGMGFESQYAQKIFEIFQRLHNVPNANGSGIGLAICKRIVQSHNGFIGATGKPNEGATFYVYIPKLQPGILQRADDN